MVWQQFTSGTVPRRTFAFKSGKSRGGSTERYNFASPSPPPSASSPPHRRQGRPPRFTSSPTLPTEGEGRSRRSHDRGRSLSPAATGDDSISSGDLGDSECSTQRSVHGFVVSNGRKSSVTKPWPEKKHSNGVKKHSSADKRPHSAGNGRQIDQNKRSKRGVKIVTGEDQRPDTTHKTGADVDKREHSTEKSTSISRPYSADKARPSLHKRRLTEVTRPSSADKRFSSIENPNSSVDRRPSSAHKIQLSADKSPYSSKRSYSSVDRPSFNSQRSYSSVDRPPSGSKKSSAYKISFNAYKTSPEGESMELLSIDRRPSSPRNHGRMQRRGSSRKVGHKTTHKRRSSKRKIKKSIRLPEREPEVTSAPSLSEKTNWLFNRKFEVPLHRDRFLREPSSSDEEEPVTVEIEETVSTDSDVYDSDLETRFATPPLSSLDTTGRTGYLKICQKLHVAPCSIFLRQATEEKLNLKYYGLGPKDAQALSLGFRDNTYISQVDLSYNYVGSEGVSHICRSLKENQHISRIDLSYCFLGREATASMAICSLIETSDNIHHLCISHNCFAGRDYKWLARLLQVHSRLYVLDISDNELGVVGCAAFAEALAENDILEELNMGWNPLMCAGAKIVLKQMSKNMKLKHLNMAYTGIDDSICRFVTDLLKKNDFLQSFDLRRNRLTYAKHRKIEYALTVCKSDMVVQLK